MNFGALIQLIAVLYNCGAIYINCSTMSNNHGANLRNKAKNLTVIVCQWLTPCLRVSHYIINPSLS